MRLSASEFVSFIARSELPVPEATSVFKPDAIPPFSEIIQAAILEYDATAQVPYCVPTLRRLDEIISWAKEANQ